MTEALIHWLLPKALCKSEVFPFSSPFAKLGKATIIFVISVRLFFRTHGRTRFPLKIIS
jgi:hypothetical protein